MLHHGVQGYMAHGYCFAWEPALVWLHVVSDIVTGLAYYSIPIALFYFAFKRRDLPFLSMFVLFGVFIFACGTTHLFAALTVYTPRYWEEGGVKAFTAVVSGVSAVLFIPLLPKAIALPSLTRALDEIKLLNITLGKQVNELRLFKNLINQANDAIFVVDPATGRFLDVNAKACSNLGYDREELLKMSVLDINDSGMHDSLSWKAHADNVKNEGHVFLEGGHRRKDGSIYPVEVNVKYISFEKSDYMLAVARDITERKKAGEELQRSEKKYRDLFESTLDGIYQIDAAGVFTLMNPAGANMFGYKNPDELIGRQSLEYWRDPRNSDIFIAELKIRKSVSGYHMRLKKKNGEPIELETSSAIKEDERGAFLGVEGIMRDVTDQKKLEAQLRHAQKMDAVGTLAGGIAHDFNNILNVIIGFGVMVMDRMGDDKLAKMYMNEVLAAAERAANLTKRLLLFSRKEVAEVKPMDVNEMIRNLQKMLSRIIGEDINLVTNLMSRKAQVMADAGQVEQVLVNLVTNARDAMPEGGSLTISTELREIDAEFIKAYEYGVPGTYAVISISDTGTGIDKEKQIRIFDPFFTTKEVGKGTGLGLSIAYGIVKQHNGYIKVYSEPGRGSTFQIWLPAIDDISREQPEVQTSISPQCGTETILVAEDDASMRKLIRTVLESSGYHVISAMDGEDAIAKFIENRERINLVMLDIIMPKKSGKAAYEEIRKISPAIKVLFASGYTMDTIKTHELTSEGFDFIHKPVSSKDLLAKVREVLDR